jgi:DNA-binding beta-propeller fold protein YncE
VVYAVDVATHSIVDSIHIGTIIHLALHPTQPRLYASAINEAKVYEIDTATLDTLRSFTLSGTVQDLAVTPDGGTLYVADETNKVHVVNLSTGNHTSITTGVCSAYGLLVTNDGLQVYISCSLSGQIQVIDIGTSAVINTLPGLGTVRRMALSSDGLSVVAVTEGGNAILIQ